jgi:hypothetical protein
MNKEQNITEKRSSLRRTLIFAGVFALLTMLVIPTPTPTRGYGNGGYRFIFDPEHTGVAFFQLLVNVVFAAGVGALLAQVPMRAILAKCSVRGVVVTIMTAVVITAVVATVIVSNMSREEYRRKAEADEREARNALNVANTNDDYFPYLTAAKIAEVRIANRNHASWFYRKAAENWRNAVEWERAKQAEALAKKVKEPGALPSYEELVGETPLPATKPSPPPG